MGEEPRRCRFEIWTESRCGCLPPTLDELLPLDHPARFVAEFVDALGRDGWSELGVEIGGDPLGAPAYHPRALLSVWLYGFHDRCALVPEAGGGLPGPDIVSVADRVAASRPQHLVAILQRTQAGNEEAAQADGSYGGGHGVGGTWRFRRWMARRWSPTPR